MKQILIECCGKCGGMYYRVTNHGLGRDYHCGHTAIRESKPEPDNLVEYNTIAVWCPLEDVTTVYEACPDLKPNQTFDDWVYNLKLEIRGYALKQLCDGKNNLEDNVEGIDGILDDQATVIRQKLNDKVTRIAELERKLNQRIEAEREYKERLVEKLLEFFVFEDIHCNEYAIKNIIDTTPIVKEQTDD